MTEEDNSAAFRRLAVWLRLMPGYVMNFDMWQACHTFYRER
ncbi:MAG: hypothetical protein K0R50_1209 [Eubacterium sp.]|nr:hypothetical protein [Eubacterium sp.]